MTARNALSVASTIRLNSGFEIPQLGFGVYQSTDAFTSCKTALEFGYRHASLFSNGSASKLTGFLFLQIDSARGYKNEAEVAKATRESGIDRSSLFLTTKVLSREHGYEPCVAAVEDSVKNLGGPWDLILLHDPMGGKEKRVEAYRALADALKAGKTKSIGVSNFGVPHLKELKAANVGPTPSVNQIELHPWCQQKDIVDYCKENGIVVQAYSPLTRGHFFSDPTLKSISDRYSKTPAQVLVRWSLQRGFVPLPKSDTASRIKENADVFDFELNAEAMKQLGGLDKGSDGALTWNPTSIDRRYWGNVPVPPATTLLTVTPTSTATVTNSFTLTTESTSITTLAGQPTYVPGSDVPYTGTGGSRKRAQVGLEARAPSKAQKTSAKKAKTKKPVKTKSIKTSTTATPTVTKTGVVTAAAVTTTSTTTVTVQTVYTGTITGFEPTSGPGSSWTYAGLGQNNALQTESTTVHSGNSAGILPAAPYAYYIILNTGVTVEAGAEYRFGCYFYSDKAAFVGAVGYTNKLSSGGTNGQWELLPNTFNTLNAGFVEFEAGQGAGNANNAYIDDCFLYRIG